MTRQFVKLAGAAALLAANPAAAQDDRMVAIAEPDQPGAIALNTGELPGATVGESWHRQHGSVFTRNVTEATLTPFLPEPGKATGTAVIVAPGGAFRVLSMENEGWDVARALARRGVAAFVLKYRLNQTQADLAEFEESMSQALASTNLGALSAEQAAPNLSLQVADAEASFALVRSRAEEWQIDPERIGMIGFSAGAMLTMATEYAGENANPAFVGNIYGPMAPTQAKSDSPPMFAALAADDALFPEPEFGVVLSWLEAGLPTEFHLYERGGHGFGMYQKDTTSTGWFADFVAWMDMHGWLAEPYWNPR